MLYSRLVSVYEELSSTTKKLQKTEIIANFLSKIKKEHNRRDMVYLLQGRVWPENNTTETGVSEQLTIKAIAQASDMSAEEVTERWRIVGDLGDVAEELGIKKNKEEKGLTIEQVISNIRKLSVFTGKGTVEKKLNLISELLNNASAKEEKYIIRTILADLRVGVKEGLLRDAIFDSCLRSEDDSETEKNKKLLQRAYDLTTDFGLVFDYACDGIERLKEVSLMPGNPIKVMLFPKAESIEDAFEIVGKPAAFEYKYDGFRVIISKSKEDGEVKVYTRRLEEVSKQFPDLVKYVNENITAETFIVDGEAVGYNPKTKNYVPFQEISQRIKRIYDIEKLEKDLPIELVLFDLIYVNGESLLEKPFIQRRKALEKIVKIKPYKTTLSKQIITDKTEEVERFYEEALEVGEEGIMGKNLDSPYKPGARVGYAVKLKPHDDEFDLVITKAEYGTGKRAGWLTSYTVACRGKNGELLEVAKVSTGLKEKREEGLSFEELTEMLTPLIISSDGREVIVKPRILAEVQYQNIQKSPTYASGFSLRFPRIKRTRPDRRVEDANTLQDIEKEYEGKKG
jgi:DNA ligase 1